MNQTLNPTWLPKVSMKRIIWHWTAGSYTPNKTDLSAYHFVIDGNGVWHRGVDVAKNSGSLKSGYAAHTRRLNTDSIGVSLACMAGAVESPFNPGKYPMKRLQIESLIDGTRQLCTAYGIPVGRKTTLSHAEVQTTLGVAQQQKWDYTRLPFDDSLRGALNIGDWIRDMVSTPDLLTPQPPDEQPVFPARALLTTKTATATTTTAAGEVTGSLPAGTLVTLLAQDDKLVKVLTPAGYTVFAAAPAFDLVGVTDNETEQTTPSSTRGVITSIRDLLDKLENSLEGD